MNSRLPLIVAHRGASCDAPENTLAAFKLAWVHGADAIEGDFRLTQDGSIVCLHDQTTRRTAGPRLVVENSALTDLRQLDVGSWKGKKWQGERIPTIGEVFATVPEGKKIFVEIKSGPDILPPLQRAISGSCLKTDQIVLISFGEDLIAEAKRQLPGVKAMWLTDYKRGKRPGNWIPSREQILTTLARIRADGLNSRAHRMVDRGLVEALRASRLEIHVWTVDHPAIASRFAALGVDSLTTNRPRRLRQQLTRADIS